MGQAHSLLRQLDRLTASPVCLSDSELLQRFTAQGDEGAFESLVRRHGPLVLRVARRVLHDAHDADDVFQATFLTLARKAGSIRKQPSVACWLHGVAYRLALQARTAHVRRQVHESRAARRDLSDPLEEITLREAQTILDEELGCLAEIYRAPLVLCYLAGHTRDEAARQLGWSLGTFKRRLEEARGRLRARLHRRGLGLPAVLSAQLLPHPTTPTVPSSLLRRTVRAAALAGMHRSLAGTRMVLLVLAVGCLITGAAVLARQTGADAAPDARTVDARTEAPAPKAAARTDLHGDPLPPGAVMRLGTVRFRPGETVGQMAFSPDGKLLVALSQNMEGNGNPNVISVWDRVTGRRLRTFGSERQQYLALAVSPDGRVVGTQSLWGPVCLWDLATGRRSREVTKGGLSLSAERGPNQRVMGVGVVFSPDGKLVAARGPDKALHLWEVATGKDVRRFVVKPEDNGPGAFSPNGKLLATVAEGVIRLWDVDGAREVRQLRGHEGPAGGIRFSGDGKTLAACMATPGQNFRTTIYVWDVTTGKVLRHFQPGKGGMDFGIAFSGDLRRGVVAGCPTVLFDLATGREIHRLDTLDSNPFAVAFAPDGKTVATGGTGRAIWLWDADTGKPLQPQAGHTGIIESLAVSPDGKTAASVAFDPDVWLWDLETGKPRARYHVPDVRFGAAAFAPDRRGLAVTGNDAFVRILDADSGQELRRLEGAPGQTAVRYSPDGKLLAAVSRRDGLIRIWDVVSGKLLQALKALPPRAGSQPCFLCFAFSPDGKYLATGGYGDSACIWSVATGKLVRQLPGHDYWVSSLCFSPDGRILATTSFDNSIRLWEVWSGKERRRLVGHAKRVQSVAFSPDGRHLASGSDDQTVRVWDLATAAECGRFVGHDGVVGPVAFAPDGKRLLSASWDTTILVWDVAAGIRSAKQSPASLSRRQLESLWAELAGTDGARADRAGWELAADPGQAVPFLGEHLHPAGPADVRRLTALVRDLGNDRFAVREEAMVKLAQEGQRAEAVLRQALATGPALEVRRRIERLLEELEKPLPNGDELRVLRAIEVLEHAGTPAARRLLASLAEGAAEARPTNAARAALRRLGAH